MTYTLVLGTRSLREMRRTPEALLPTLFIPMFFLVDRMAYRAYQRRLGRG